MVRWDDEERDRRGRPMRAGFDAGAVERVSGIGQGADLELNDEPQCECADAGCRHEAGRLQCPRSAETTVVRAEAEEPVLVSMCMKCASDGIEAGFYVADEESWRERR